jgi:HK97 gp10 family phage protein
VGVVVKLNMGPLLRLKANARPKAARIVGRTAFLVEGGAKQRAAVDTGAMRNSIKAEQIGELSWEVGPHVDYAWYQEFGTSRMAAHPFLIPAVEAQRGQFAADMAELFE